MIEKKKKYKLGDFDYPLPKKYIAQYPGNKRDQSKLCLLYTSPSPRDATLSRMPGWA